MAERRKQQQEDSGNVKNKRPDEGKRWVSVGLPNGKEFEVSDMNLSLCLVAVN